VTRGKPVFLTIILCVTAGCLQTYNGPDLFQEPVHEMVSTDTVGLWEDVPTYKDKPGRVRLAEGDATFEWACYEGYCRRTLGATITNQRIQVQASRCDYQSGKASLCGLAGSTYPPCPMDAPKTAYEDCFVRRGNLMDLHYKHGVLTLKKIGD
jgi:hypothetical protein